MCNRYFDSFTDLPSNLVSKVEDCKFGLVNSCLMDEPSMNDCLFCHRAEMKRTRDAYLDFYKNVFIPWNNNNEQN